MPVLYQAKCSNCDFESKYMADHELAIAHDEPVDSTFRHKTLTNLVVLAHPLEVSILDGLGKSLEELYREGRVIGINHNICRSCGHLFEGFSLVQVGCGSREALSWIVSLTCGLTLYFWFKMIIVPIILVFVLFFILSSLFDQAVYKKVLQEYSFRLEDMPTPWCCPDCHGEDIVNVTESKKVFPCTSCHCQTVKIESAAIS